ncbi:MAG TPA: class I SAM-dependent methyltransferase, partial [Rhodoferax sp.]|nr:class I SAM-dependent methyltransferase [Rhodoferax sp.]
MMPRVVAAEALDGLPQDDPSAMRSRRDLRRVHRAMGTRQIILRALKAMKLTRLEAEPLRILEIGAGDGSLMLGVAQALDSTWPKVALTLLDRQALVTPATVASYQAVGWTVSTEVADVLDWAERDTDTQPGAPPRWDLVVANLFLHHFEGEQLARLMQAIALKSDRLLACEPRRDRLALVGSHLTGVIGANAVTRED